MVCHFCRQRSHPHIHMICTFQTRHHTMHFPFLYWGAKLVHWFDTIGKSLETQLYHTVMYLDRYDVEYDSLRIATPKSKIQERRRGRLPCIGPQPLPYCSIVARSGRPGEQNTALDLLLWLMSFELQDSWGWLGERHHANLIWLLWSLRNSSMV